MSDTEKAITLNGKEFIIDDFETSTSNGVTKYKITAKDGQDIKEWLDSGHNIITVKNYPTCPECSLLGDDDWEYCPHDGTKLDPAAPPERYEIDRYGQRVDGGE